VKQTSFQCLAVTTDNQKRTTMTLMRVNRFPTLFREFDELFRNYASPFNPEETTQSFIPAADVVEHPKHLEIRLDMPGVNPEQIEVKLDGDQLTISAERKEEKKTEDAGWIRQERTQGRFTRTFNLPSSIDGAKPEATYKHGVLVVTLPKREEVLPRSLKVKVEA
jgi:HSP20 family protein